jgi:hypothetical protein
VGGGERSEDLASHGRIILRLILGGCGLDASGTGCGEVVGSIKGGDYLLSSRRTQLCYLGRDAV